MNISVSCGGTGGHVFPGLATAAVLRRRGHEVRLWVTGRDVERRALAGWDGAREIVPAAGFPHFFSWRAVRSGARLVAGFLTCRRLMSRNRPEILLAMGSYASVPPALAARSLNVPIVLHEGNAVPGRATRLLASRAALVALHFPQARGFFPDKLRCEVVGFPLREGFAPTQAPDLAALPARDQFSVLVIGGSQGARRLNETAVSALCALHEAGLAVRVVHLAGAQHETAVRTAYEKCGVAHAVHGFLADMPTAYRQADLAVCRAGAATCAELAAFGVPALLVPLPSAVRDHQRANAEAVVGRGAAELLPESELSGATLAAAIRAKQADPDRLAAMRRAALEAARPDAAERLAEVVEKIAGRA